MIHLICFFRHKFGYEECYQSSRRAATHGEEITLGPLRHGKTAKIHILEGANNVFLSAQNFCYNSVSYFRGWLCTFFQRQKNAFPRLSYFGGMVYRFFHLNFT